MLQADEQQQKHIEMMLGKEFDLMYATNHGVKVDSYLSYDQMAKIVDYLRTSDKKDDLFEECWIAYKRKGSKKKSKEYWLKLTDVEKRNVLAHIKAYVSARELQFQKDFERYLRDKIFTTIVFKNNVIIYDPSKIGKGEQQSDVYMPVCDGSLSWNDYYHCFMYVGYWDGRHIPDGYTDDNRPNGASITLNNGRGVIIWNNMTKTWNKKLL